MAQTITDTGDTVAISQGFSPGFSQGFRGPIVQVSGHLMKPINCVVVGRQPGEPGNPFALNDTALKSIFRE